MGDQLRQFKAEIFQALAHPTRIAIAEILRDGELSAGSIMGILELEQANVSQHLTVLRTKRVVIGRKVGNQVFYRLRDPVLLEVLDLLKNYFYSQAAESVAALQAFDEEGVGRENEVARR